MLLGSWWLVLPVTRAPEQSPAGASPDFTQRTGSLPSPHYTGARMAVALPSQADILCLFRTLTTFPNLSVLIVHLPGLMRGSSDIPGCEGV